MTITLTYSGRTRPSAEAIEQAGDGEIILYRGYEGDINWGRDLAGTMLNPVIANATNKRVMRELLREAGIPMPRQLTLEEAAQWAAAGVPLIGRPDRHTQGRGLWRVTSTDEFIKALKGTRRKRAATHFMEFVAATHEFRVHIFCGRSIRISEKAFDRPRETSAYTTIKPSAVDLREIRRASKGAVAALGLDFGAVDVLALDDGTPYVLEVNTAPGLGGSMPRLYADAFRRWYFDDTEEEE